MFVQLLFMGFTTFIQEGLLILKDDLDDFSMISWHWWLWAKLWVPLLWKSSDYGKLLQRE